MTAGQQDKLLKTIGSLFDGTLAPSDVDAKQLAQRLATDPEARALYAKFVTFDVGLKWSSGALRTLEIARLDSQDTLAPTSDIPSPSCVQVAPTEVHLSTVAPLSIKRAYFSWPMLKYVAVVALFLYGSFAFVAWNLRPNKLLDLTGSDVTVAMVSGATDVRWSRETTPKNSDSPIRSGELLKISSGIIELELSAGTKLVVEGPADWSVDGSNRVSLRVGKLTARVPQQATGFTVDTPTAKVVDLGTEFGVEVNESGATDVHVVRGTVEVDRSAFSSAARTLPSRKRLVAGQTIRVDRAGVGEIAFSLTTRSTLRDSPTDVVALDLVDIIAGGDGRGARRDRGINPQTGRIVLKPSDDESYSLFTKHLKSAGYIHIDDWRFIDGVGIPDPSQGAVQLDSAGHTFDGFPKTNGECYGPLWAGGLPPQSPNASQIRSTFDGITDYGIAPHRVITLIPNKLVTFDLAAIRRSSPGRSLSTFRSLVGMTHPEKVLPSYALADTWVFIDGQLLHSRQAIKASDDPVAVEVPLPASARFLTLAATDGGNDFHMDCILFADPRIEMEANDQQQSNESSSPSK